MGKHFIYHLILSVCEDGKAFVCNEKQQQQKRANNINFGVTRSLSLRESERERENFP